MGRFTSDHDGLNAMGVVIPARLPPPFYLDIFVPWISTTQKVRRFIRFQIMSTLIELTHLFTLSPLATLSRFCVRFPLGMKHICSRLFLNSLGMFQVGLG